MNVDAEIVERRVQRVTINVRDVLRGLRKEFVQKAGLPCDSYINSKGVWEFWDSCNGRGSGLTSTYREATESEIAYWNALNLLSETHKED